MDKVKICLNSTEVSEQTGLSISLIRKLTRSGEIPHIRVGRRILYPVAALENWFSAKTVGLAVPEKSGEVNG